jgi:hypothetical protein
VAGSCWTTAYALTVCLIRAAVGVAMADLVDGELAPIDPRTLAGEQPALLVQNIIDEPDRCPLRPASGNRAAACSRCNWAAVTSPRIRVRPGW